MARRYQNKRKWTKKDPFYRFGKKDSIAIKALKMASNVKRALNVEFKNTMVDQNIPSSGTAASIGNSQIWALNGLQQGSGDVQRNGSQVEFKSLSIHASLAAVGTTAHIVRFIVFKMKAPNGVAPTQAMLFEGASAPGILDFYNLENVPQGIQVLADKTYHLNGNEQTYKHVSLHLNNLNVKTRYQGITSAYTDISTNGLYAFVIQAPLDGTTTMPLRFVSRIRYVDN